MADFSAFYWSRHIFAGDRHWMDREAAVALKKLKMVSLPSRAYTSFLPWGDEYRVALGSVCQCPLGLIPHFYGTPFKNLGFMRFPEPVFAGIYQNILTTAVFRAC